ncbi:MAG: ATP-binding protein [Nitrospiraceae bacterium]|nr:ATP-binding protein [Nitrospiraceae bacterium]
MKIREKLLVGFGLYMLLAVVLGFFAYKELRTIGTRLKLVETADDITNTMLEVRRFEKNFLLYRDPANLDALRSYLGTLKDSIDNIQAEIITEIGIDDFTMLKRTLAEYERIFELIAANYNSQGELAELVRRRGRAVEQGLAPGLHEAFLNLRRHEKNVMLDRNDAAFERFRTAVASAALKGNVAVGVYAEMVERLYRLYRDEAASVESMRGTARNIQTFTENISRREREEVEAKIKTSIMLLFLALAAIIGTGTVVNIKLAKSIVDPIHDLERVTKKIARGDFSETIKVAGHDEIAALADSFNQMERKLDHTLGALEDVIKQIQEKQARLVEAEKLASIGKLAAGIAHEINNPLTSVLTFSNLMLEQCPPSDPRHEKLKLMARETDRARTIVRQLLNFGRESVIKPEKININRPVGEITESLAAQEAFKGIDLSVELADDLPEVYADPAQVGQVVLNILLNAIHAITLPGRIEVRTRRTERHVEIVFSDTGKGIPEEHLHKIFDPFFTTKDATKGTGLGLAVSYGIIQKHGGEIAVESTVGKGTTFRVRLPLYG